MRTKQWEIWLKMDTKVSLLISLVYIWLNSACHQQKNPQKYTKSLQNQTETALA